MKREELALLCKRGGSVFIVFLWVVLCVKKSTPVAKPGGDGREDAPFCGCAEPSRFAVEEKRGSGAGEEEGPFGKEVKKVFKERGRS